MITTPADQKFQTLYTKFMPTVRKIALHYVKADADDACQTVMTSLWRALQAGEKIKAPQAWLTEVARNTCLNMIRASRPDASFEEIEDTLQEPAEEMFQEPVVDPRLKAALKVAVDRMSPRLRAVITMRFWGAKTVHETALELGITDAAVKMALSRGYAELRSLFTRPADHQEAA